MSSPTRVPRANAVVVVVGGPLELVDAARLAAGVVAARVETAELATAATVIATHRPFAVILSEDMYAFDAAEFDALARDVNAVLLRLDTSGATRAKLERVLMPRIAQAHRRRPA
jgi:hypothetical protein